MRTNELKKLKKEFDEFYQDGEIENNVREFWSAKYGVSNEDRENELIDYLCGEYKTKTIKCVCESQGLLILGHNFIKNEDGSVPDYERGIAHYEIKSAEDLYYLGKSYYKVERFNGNIEKGADYTLNKAKNDFKYLAQERITKTDVAGLNYQE